MYRVLVSSTGWRMVSALTGKHLVVFLPNQSLDISRTTDFGTNILSTFHSYNT